MISVHMHPHDMPNDDVIDMELMTTGDPITLRVVFLLPGITSENMKIDVPAM